MQGFSINELSRYLYPGAAIVAYGVWRFEIQAPSEMFVLVVIGLVVYPLYRATFHQFIRALMARWPGIPQYEYHKKFVPSATRREASICAGHVLGKVPNTERERLDLWNASVHVMYMTTCLLLIAAGAELWLHGNDWLPRFIFLIGFATFTLTGAIATDHLYADQHELLLLKNHETEYARATKKVREN